MDKDRGYAWVILGASTILMCIGPSTITSTGFLLYDVTVTPDMQLWILNIFYACWTLSAFLAACFAKQRPRQLSTTGAAIACVGFISSASTVNNPGWLYVTYSIAVGFGLGLSFHTAYLVVMSSFEQYKGVANGACQTCIAIGQMTTPFLYTAVNLSRDRFQIKSLTTAVGFLTTLFFVVPTQTLYQRRISMVGDRNRRRGSGNIIRRASLTEGVPLHSGFIIQPSATVSMPNQGMPRTRRRSQYLLAVSASLLPNIPEEPEGVHSTHETLTSISSEGESGVLDKDLTSASIDPLANNGILKSVEKTPEGVEPNNQTEPREEENHKNEIGGVIPKPHIPVRRLSEGCSPAYVGNVYVGKVNETKKKIQDNSTALVTKPIENEANSKTRPKYRRYSESQLQKPVLTPPTIPPNSNSLGKSAAFSVRKLSTESSKSQDKNKAQQQNPQARSSTGESIIDFKLLQDVHFLNMATFSAWCVVTIMNFPLVFYFYIVSKCEDCEVQASTAMLIIYVVDLISRPIFSYLSDLRFLSARKAFLIGCFCSGIIIAVLTLLKDFTLIYCFCTLYGMCLGMMITSEYLMFAEDFGSKRFAQAYGFVNLFKLTAVVLLGVVLVNPLGSFLYPIHPLDIADHPKNLTLICDDLGIVDVSSSSSHIRLLLSIAVPVILCALAWITEDIYKASQKCSVQSANKNLSSSMNTTDVP